MGHVRSPFWLLEQVEIGIFAGGFVCRLAVFLSLSFEAQALFLVVYGV